MGMKEALLNDFSGGLNLRDAPSEVAESETPDCENVTLDERGGVQKRLGFKQKLFSPIHRNRATVFTTPYTPQVMFEWKTKGLTFTQCGPFLFEDKQAASFGNFDTAATVAFCEFGDACYAIHPVSGLFKSTDGVTFVRQDTGPKGTALAAWQGRLIAAGDPANPTTLYGSAIDDGTDWSTAEGHGWTNKLDDIDAQPIVALLAAPGVDIAGNPGLIACKHRSSYRVNDANSGAYQLLDATVGTANAQTLQAEGPWVYSLLDTGIYRSDGLTPFVEMSAKVRPLFQPSQIAYDQLDKYRAGASRGRLHFSLPKAGSAVNDLHLEHHPGQGWIVPHTDAVSCYLTSRDGTETLYGGSPTVGGQVFQLLTGGTDNNLPITCRYQTKWVSPVGGVNAIFRRLRLFGRGAFNLYVKVDFDSSAGDLNAVSMIGGALVWDTGSWDVDKWAPFSIEGGQEDFFSLGRGSAISFKFTETSSDVGARPASVISDLPSPEAGAFAVYALLLQFVPIGV